MSNFLATKKIHDKKWIGHISFLEATRIFISLVTETTIKNEQNKNFKTQITAILRKSNLVK